MKYKKD
jgi:hypothetical protein